MPSTHSLSEPWHSVSSQHIAHSTSHICLCHSKSTSTGLLRMSSAGFRPPTGSNMTGISECRLQRSPMTRHSGLIRIRTASQNTLKGPGTRLQPRPRQWICAETAGSKATTSPRAPTSSSRKRGGLLNQARPAYHSTPHLPELQRRRLFHSLQARAKAHVFPVRRQPAWRVRLYVLAHPCG